MANASLAAMFLHMSVKLDDACELVAFCSWGLGLVSEAEQAPSGHENHSPLAYLPTKRIEFVQVARLMFGPLRFVLAIDTAFKATIHPRRPGLR